MAFLTKCHQKKVFEDNKYIKLKDTDEDLFKDALPEITAITTVTTKKRKQEFVDDVRELESDEEGDDTSKAWKGFNFNDNKFGISLKDDVDDQGTTSPLSGLTRAIYEDDTDTRYYEEDEDTGGEVNGGVRVNAGVTSNDDDETHAAVDMTQAQQSQGASPPQPAVLSLLSSALSSAEVTAAKSSAKKAQAAYAFIEAKAAEEGKSAAAAAAAAATKDTPKKGKSPGKSPRRKETARITATAPKPSDRQQRLIDAQKK